MQLLADWQAFREEIDIDTVQRRERRTPSSGMQASKTTAENRAWERVRSRYDWESPSSSNTLYSAMIQNHTRRDFARTHACSKTRTAAYVVIIALAERRGPVLQTASSNTVVDELLAAIGVATCVTAGSSTQR